MTAVDDGRAAKVELAAQSFDAVFCSVSETEALAGDAAAIPRVATLPRGALREGMEAVASGLACDCLVVPASADEVAMALLRAARLAPLLGAAAAAPAQAQRDDASDDAQQGTGETGAARDAQPARRRPRAKLVVVGGMVGASAAIKDVFATIDKVARHKAAVLITGESGTGKELVARAIHDASQRKGKNFVAINCGAIPANLLESELFGYRRGAFTDAVRDKTGLFEVADGGTLFLDEIGELPLNLQVKLLRVLQEEEIRRIGDNRTTKIDVRIVAATLRNLGEDAENGRFREDLFYRLNVLNIVLPALRERRADIAPLAEHFVAAYRKRHKSSQPRAEGISEAAMGLLEAYAWPGNIRELENTIERAMVLADGPLIEPHLLDAKIAQFAPAGAAQTAPAASASASDEDLRSVAIALDGDDLSIKKHTRLFEERLVRIALGKTDGNRHNASKLLGISYRALLYKIKEYGI
ncbi:sigma-54 interaction domain-containing protein [Haliangium ochraceum]|uniref:sigma-54 interaction domain-containing protein n=1 Tax=Haliangium ochraceum TaxID=80816 RepID=UPI00019B94AA|nr:sigma 54-interacting transcriptional regulator [Haliangium ochraceum]